MGNGRLAGRLPANPRRGPAHRPQQCQAPELVKRYWLDSAIMSAGRF